MESDAGEHGQLGIGNFAETHVKSIKFDNVTSCTCTGACSYDKTNGSSSDDYGFIPLTPLGKFKQGPSQNGSKLGYVALHQLLSNSGVPNCVDRQIPIQSDLNVSLWDKLLENNRDHQLIYFIKYGFPLDISRSSEFEPQTVITNHSSATQYSQSVSKYLATETNHKAILGPFKTSPVDNLHCSPMLTRPKSGSTSRRVIVDLSWPHGNSVNDLVCNDSYLGTSFKLTFPSVDDITARVRKLDGNCLLYKVDLQRAFRHLKLDPRDICNTGLRFMDECYIDTAVPFGYRHGSVLMQRVTDSIRCIMHKRGYFIVNYIDDLIGCDKPQVAREAYKFLKNLIVQLGLVISEEKLFAPQTCIPFWASM